MLNFLNVMQPTLTPCCSVAAIAVSCGSDLLLYKNNKPYFKFSLPPLPVSALEKDVWRKLQDSNIDIQKAIDDLKTVSYNSLSSRWRNWRKQSIERIVTVRLFRSQYLLNLTTEKAEEFVRKYADTEPVKASTITCLTTLNRNSHEKYSVACPVLATEAGHVYILDPQALCVVHQVFVLRFSKKGCSDFKTIVFVIQIHLFIADFSHKTVQVARSVQRSCLH